MQELRYLIMVLMACLWQRAETQPADSLRRAYASSEGTAVQLSLSSELCAHYSLNSHDSTAFFCRKAIELGRQQEAPSAVIYALINLGFWHHRKSQYDTALLHYHRALRLSKKHQREAQQADIYNNLAITHQRMAQADSAYFYWSQAERIYQRLGNPPETWKVYSGLFALFREKQDTAQANRYARLAYQGVQKSDNRGNRGYMIFQLMQYYFQSGQFEQMAAFQRKWDAFKLEQKPDEALMQQPAHIALYMDAADDDEALERQLQRAIQHFEQSGVPYRAGWTYEDLAKFYHQRGRNAEAFAALQQALQYYEQAKVPYRRGRALSLLYQWKKAAGQTAEALAYLEAYESLEDSLSSITMEKNLNALRVKAETEKKEQALQIKELELVQKTQERNIFLFSSLLLAALAAAIFLGLRQRLMNNRRLAKQEQRLQQQQIQQLEQQARLNALQSMIQGQEQERLRIANDLHDSLGGLITSVNNHFAAICRTEEPGKRRSLSKRTESLIAQAGQELRRISQNLMPRSLTLLGLEGAMEDLASQLREQRLNAQFQAIDLEVRLPEETAVTLYRITQELTNNILKHAEAQTVLLQLLQRDGSLFLTVEDDGKGFDLEAARQKASLGMSSVASRVDYLKGELDIDTTPGQGTTVSIQVPL